jgi:hypothetical protein
LAQNEEFEHLLMLRESRQTNQFSIILRHPDQIDTSALATLSTSSDMFCYAQMNHEDSLLQALNSFYGLSFGDRVKYISRFHWELQEKLLTPSSSGKPNETTPVSQIIKLETLRRENMLKTLPDSMFGQFMKEMSEELEPQPTASNSCK